MQHSQNGLYGRWHNMTEMPATVIDIIRTSSKTI